MHACLLDYFTIPYVSRRLCTLNMPFFTKSQPKQFWFQRRISGLWCDYSQKILKYESTSEADRDEMHWKLMLLWGLRPPRGALTALPVQPDHFYSIGHKMRCSECSKSDCCSLSPAVGFNMYLVKFQGKCINTHFHRCVNWSHIQDGFVSTENQTCCKNKDMCEQLHPSSRHHLHHLWMCLGFFF